MNFSFLPQVFGVTQKSLHFIVSFTKFHYWRNGIKSNDTSSFNLTTIVISNIWKRFEFFLLNFDQLNFFHISEKSVTENVITEIKTIKHLLLLLGIKFYLVQNTSNCHWLFSILTVMTFLHRIPNRISHFPEQSYCRPWGRGLSCKCCSRKQGKTWSAGEQVLLISSVNDIPVC